MTINEYKTVELASFNELAGMSEAEASSFCEYEMYLWSGEVMKLSRGCAVNFRMPIITDPIGNPTSIITIEGDLLLNDGTIHKSVVS